MTTITTVKQDGFIDSEKVQQWKIKIFGLGSIGSIMAKQLALVGFKDITGYDYDTVDHDNIGSQEYTKEHVGMLKTQALQKLLLDRYDFPIAVIDGKLDSDTEILPEENTIYFCAFDSLEARKLLWDKLKSFPIVWAESRIGLTYQRFYIMDLRTATEEQKQKYEESLNPEGPRVELKCGEKGCYPSNVELVSKLVRQFVNIAEEKPVATVMIGDWGTPPPIFVAPKQEVPSVVSYETS
jgi:molybdopterin/thiamine biosynthesis adenylyltransferase